MTRKSFFRYFGCLSIGTKATASSTVKIPWFRPTQSAAAIIHSPTSLTEKKVLQKEPSSWWKLCHWFWVSLPFICPRLVMHSSWQEYKIEPMSDTSAAIKSLASRNKKPHHYVLWEKAYAISHPSSRRNPSRAIAASGQHPVVALIHWNIVGTSL